MRTPQDMLALCDLEEKLERLRHRITYLFYGGSCSQAFWNLTLMLMDYVTLNRVLKFSALQFSNLYNYVQSVTTTTTTNMLICLFLLMLYIIICICLV